MWRKTFSGCGLLGRLKELQFVFAISLLFIILQLQIVKVRSDDVENKDKITTTTTSTMSSYENKTFNGKPCKPNYLDECLAKLPSMKEPNIPTTSKEVEIVCNAFKMGMDCVQNYSKQCLTERQQQQVKSTARGAHEAFTFLCYDEKFRAEFLSHSVCYKKISRSWDGCAASFIESLKKTDQRESLSVCCIRLRFLVCIKELARLHCTNDAERFLQKMAETLVTSNMRNNNTSECVDVKSANCSEASGACSPVKLSVLLQPSKLIRDFVISIVPSSSLATARHFGLRLLKLFSLEWINEWMSFRVLSLLEFREWIVG